MINKDCGESVFTPEDEEVSPNSWEGKGKLCRDVSLLNQLTVSLQVPAPKGLKECKMRHWKLSNTYFKKCITGS